MARPEVRRMEGSMDAVQLQLQLLKNKADVLQDRLLHSQSHREREALAAKVQSFISTCQPYFNQLENAARGMNYQLGTVTFDTYAKRMQLLDYSQQLCNRLEKLVLTYANQHLLSLDELEPHSVSSFCIGQTQLCSLKLTTYLYCRPAPYLAQVETGLHKRMRWNVVRLAEEHSKEDPGGNTEYYFLCYEEVLSTLMHADGRVLGCEKDRLWSIGLWMPEFPGPDTEDVLEWILCNTPQANYHRLRVLGPDEPSSSMATDVLLQLLLSPQKTQVDCCSTSSSSSPSLSPSCSPSPSSSSSPSPPPTPLPSRK